MSKKAKNINPLIKKIFEENDVENISDAQNIMKDMFKDMVSLMLKSEMDETFGYSKYGRNTNNNSRNGLKNTILGKNIKNVSNNLSRTSRKIYVKREPF